MKSSTPGRDGHYWVYMESGEYSVVELTRGVVRFIGTEWECDVNDHEALRNQGVKFWGSRLRDPKLKRPPAATP